MRTLPLPVEPLTAEAFAPFGAILPDPGPAAFTSGTLQTWRFPFEVDDAVLVTLCRFRREPMRFSRLERHLAVTQAFLPLAGRRSVMVVAPATAEGEPVVPPEPATVRAFELTGAAGLVLWRGTWHALRRFPLDDPHVDFVLLTSRATQAEIEAAAAAGEAPSRLTQEVDFARSHALGFEVRLTA
jgi:ureidoglycolate lyase